MDRKLILMLVGVAVALGVLGYFFGAKSPRNANQGMTTTVQQILDKKTVKIGSASINVEVADTEAKKQQGLSGRSSLGNGQGMLFVFGTSGKPAFWMKDMNFAIDIIWIREGKIVGISRDARPEPGVNDQNLKLYYAPSQVDYVLEVNAGVSDQSGFKVGDTVELAI